MADRQMKFQGLRVLGLGLSMGLGFLIGTLEWYKLCRSNWGAYKLRET